MRDKEVRKRMKTENGERKDGKDGIGWKESRGREIENRLRALEKNRR